MPATFQRQPAWLNGTTQCSGDDSSPCNVTNSTRADERNHLRYVIPTVMKWSGGIFPSGNFTLRRLFLQLGRFLRSADAQGLNDMSGGGSVHLNKLCSKRSQPLAGAGWRWIIAATWRGTIQPHNSKFARLPGIATL